MILSSESNYVVSGFGPPDRETFLGGWGFSIGLKGDFARKCLEHKLTEQNVERFNEIGKKLLAKTFKDKDFRDPYHFFDDTKDHCLLLKWLTVPGNACDLGSSGVTPKQIKVYHNERFLEYDPHNVDTMSQACLLLTLFLQWHDFAVAILTPDKNGTTKGT